MLSNSSNRTIISFIKITRLREKFLIQFLNRLNLHNQYHSNNRNYKAEIIAWDKIRVVKAITVRQEMIAIAITSDLEQHLIKLLMG